MTKARGYANARLLRLTIAAFVLLFGALTLACSDGPDTSPGAIHVLTTDGDVNPIMERYIDRGIDNAEDEDAAAVVIRLDTPGGLLTSMDDIIKRILDSDVPVIVYVWPSGGHAASAGTYIAYASHIAAMAPATTIGSATPINADGSDINDDLRNKVIGDAVAKIRGYAELRDRNAEWAEDAVRSGISADSSEALELNVVNYVAEDLESLLAQADGDSVVMEGGREQFVQTQDAEIAYNNRTFIENFLDLIANPNIAFLLLSLGSLALFIEIIHPGGIFPGVFGVISLLLAFFALSVIPFNWAGVALILVAFILFGLELFVVSHGVLGIGGAVALVFGGLILTSGNPEQYQVSPWVVFTLAGTLGSLVIFVFVQVVRIRTLPSSMGLEAVVGRTAVARSPLDPRGFVTMDGETWTAEAEGGSIQPGQKVIVTEIKGLRLKVRKS